MAAIPGLENIHLGAYLGKIMFYLGYSIALIMIFSVLGFFYYTTSFKIKAKIIPIYGSGKDGVFSIGKPRSNRIKWIKKRTAWKTLYPLFNKKEREPFDAEYIYPGNIVYAFDLNGEWSPGRVNINQTENKIRGEINPVPYWVRNWSDAENRLDDIEFTKHDFFSEIKQYLPLIITVIGCCLMVGFTVWASYKYAGGGTEAMSSLTNAINSMVSSGGKPSG